MLKVRYSVSKKQKFLQFKGEPGAFHEHQNRSNLCNVVRSRLRELDEVAQIYYSVLLIYRVGCNVHRRLTRRRDIL